VKAQVTDEVPVLVADCGSTATKTALFRRAAGRWRLLGRGQAPTTVEAPCEDMMVGLRAAAGRLRSEDGERVAVTLPADDRVHRAGEGGPSAADGGDAAAKRSCSLVATSSAAGGLQMVVMGVVRRLTAASGERAAMGAGGIVTDIIAYGDGRTRAEIRARLERSRPDLVLLCGGTDGGATRQVVELAELLAEADVRPRFGQGDPLPVIYAGNRDARPEVAAVLGDRFALATADNVQPTLEREEPADARRAIHAAFLDHVMARAPGYRELVALSAAPVQPTPAAVGEAARQLSLRLGQPVVAVDLGGATTDVFSVRGGDLVRTVSANLGVSYSLASVVQAAGSDGIGRWLPFAWTECELRNRLLNKMIRPWTLPATVEDLAVEQAAAREALRLAWCQHLAVLATQADRADRLDGAAPEAAAFDDARAPTGSAAPPRGSLLLATGGLLARAPRGRQAAAILVDALQPIGVVPLLLDEQQILAQAGALAGLDPAAVELLAGPLLRPLGVCVAPRHDGRGGRVLARCRLTVSGQLPREGLLVAGELRRLELRPEETAELEVEPARGVDLGVGPGGDAGPASGTGAGADRSCWRGRIQGSDAGVLLDGRGRPLRWAADGETRRRDVASWWRALDLLPEGTW
jgi:hypothetical protein